MFDGTIITIDQIKLSLTSRAADCLLAELSFAHPGHASAFNKWMLVRVRRQYITTMTSTAQQSHATWQQFQGVTGA